MILLINFQALVLVYESQFFAIKDIHKGRPIFFDNPISMTTFSNIFNM